MKLTGIIGKARCGKSTAAEHLVLNYGYLSISCADPMKKLIVTALDKNPPPQDVLREIHNRALPYAKDGIYDNRTPFTRWLLQFVGTDIGRAVDPNVWVNLLINHVTAVSELNPKVKVVVPDVRFPNEVQAIRMLGGKVLKITRGDEGEKIEFGEGHESEQSDKLDYDIVISPEEGAEYVKLLVDSSIDYLEG